MKKILKKLWLVVVAVFSIVLIAFGTLLIGNASMITNVLPLILAVKSEQPADKKEEIMSQGKDLANTIEEEGIVLLRNEENTLPLHKDINKVNVFGWGSSEWLAGGSGSGTVANLEVDFLNALKNYGIEYNEELISMYNEFHGPRPYETLSAYDYEAYKLYEPSINNRDYYTEELLDQAKEYSDTAIFVLGRFAGESSDAPKVQYKVVESDSENEGKTVTDESKTYLDLSTEEEETLSYLGKNYKNVIVVVNSLNTMSLAELESIPGIDAALLVGATGTSAVEAVPAVLYGDSTPSGKVVDTYAYDLSTSASYANSGLDGIGAYNNAKGFYPFDGETINGNVGNYDTLYEQVSYLDYVEGIYVGYKWYETADVEGYWDEVDNEFGKGYDGIVQFPFGYGLSYTTFDWSVDSFSPKNTDSLNSDDDIKAKVTVTNTGNYPGKDVVQLYFSAPYVEGGIEKSSINLGDFVKTKTLEPGESQTVELTLNVRDMASYDDKDLNNNGYTGYELDAGKYEVKIMRDAHTLLEDDDAIQTYDIDEIHYPTDKYTGNLVNNQFVGENIVDGISTDGSDSEEDINYMTRANFKETFPQENIPNRDMSEILKENNLFTEKMANEWSNEEEEKEVTYEQDNGLKVYDNNEITEVGMELGLNYRDDRWEKLLNQMSKKEMENLVLHGYVHTEAVDSIGKPVRVDLDGPSQVNSFNFGDRGTGFPNATVLSQTWNKDLALEMGQQSAKEANSIGISGWYAPGVNIHRSPLGGRNYEYYSEDSHLSGVFAANVIKGAKEGGLYTYLKHLILYEQESNRDSIYTWIEEQPLREIYLKPYQIAIQEGGSTGIMTSYNRLGAIWAGASKALITEVVRNEWGFEGTVITDYSDHQSFMNMSHALRNGGDLWMDGALRNGEFIGDTDSNRFNQELRRASKNIIYTWLNALATNKEYNKTAETPINNMKITERLPIITITGYSIIILVISLWGLWLRKKIIRRKTID